MERRRLQQLIEQQATGHSLAQPFYLDPDIFVLDVERVFLRAWLYAGHASEIPEPGDWFLFDLERESVIVIRAEDGAIHALVNVCRHRGSRVCLEARGRSKRLACRYHGWVYGLDGALLAARRMPEGFDLGRHGLRRVHCEVLEGLVFVNFADEPAPFSEVRDALVPCLAPYRLDRAKVAHRQAYAIQANWKLAVENYTECYHCAPAHPEYSRGHGLARPEHRSPEALEQVRHAAVSCGLADRQVNRLYGNAPAPGADYGYEHYPLVRGHQTGSEDGKAVAPLLGDLRAYFGGCTDFQVGPVSFALAYPDHVVVYAFRPLAVDRSVCDISWLVRADAEEGKDYDRARLTWLWDITTQADKRIIEHNAAGVASRYYRSGPLSTMEGFTGRFIDWYLETLRGEA